MMRLVLALWWTLVVFWLWTHSLGAQSGPAAVPHTRRALTWPEEVVAFGTSPDSARENALKQVHKTLADVVPLKAWTPPPNYVEKNVLAGPGREKKSDEMNTEELALKKELERLGQTVYAWILPLRAVDWDRLKQLERYHQQEQERAGRVETRLVLLGKIHLVLVLALVLINAYFVIDAWTNGLYKAWLRLAVLGLIVAGGAGCWLLP